MGIQAVVAVAAGTRPEPRNAAPAGWDRDRATATGCATFGAAGAMAVLSAAVEATDRG